MADAYREKYGNIFQSGIIAFAVALAKDVGILDALITAAGKPLTSQEIAHQKQLKERYVREILGSLSCAELVEVKAKDDDVNEFYLSPAALEVVTSDGTSARSLLTVALAEMYQPVKECMRIDNPNTARYGDGIFNALDEMYKETSGDVIAKLLRIVPDLQQKLEQGISVAEFGCGGGRVIGGLAEMFPNSMFLASEVHPHLVERLKSRYGHLTNLSFGVHDLCALEEDMPKYDWIYTIDVIHDLPYPHKAIEGVRKIVKEPVGLFTFMDFSNSGDNVKNVGQVGIATLYSLSTFLCIPESFQKSDSVALGACGSRQRLADMATAARFKVDVMSVDPVNTLFMCRPSL